MQVYVSALIILLPIVTSRNALEYFVKHKKLRNFTMTILANDQNSTSSAWIEYKYIFNFNEKVEKRLNIDVISNSLLANLENYSFDIVEILQESLNFSVNYTINTQEDCLLPNQTDIIICEYNPKQESEIKQLYPIVRSKYILIYKQKFLKFTKDIFILTFTGLLWLIFFIILIVLAICLRISTIKYSQIHKDQHSWTWVEITLWAIAAACQQGLSYTPNGFSSCLIFFLGYLMAYLLYTGLAAGITSVLVQHNSNYNFEQIKSKMPVLISLENSRQHIKIIKENFIYTRFVENLDDFFENLNEPNRIGIGPEILIQQYMTNSFHYERILTYSTMKLNIKDFNLGVLIDKDNPYYRILNRKILRLEETGIIQRLLGRYTCCNYVFEDNSGYSSAGREHVGSAILLFLSGILLAILFLLAEFVVKFYQDNYLGL